MMSRVRLQYLKNNPKSLQRGCPCRFYLEKVKKGTRQREKMLYLSLQSMPRRLRNLQQSQRRICSKSCPRLKQQAARRSLSFWWKCFLPSSRLGLVGSRLEHSEARPRLLPCGEHTNLAGGACTAAPRLSPTQAGCPGIFQAPVGVLLLQG